MKLISRRRIEDENLAFTETERGMGEGGIGCVTLKIVDSAGVIYDAVLYEDGTVFNGFCEFEDSDTFRRAREAQEIAMKQSSSRTSRLHYAAHTGEFFEEYEVPSVCYSRVWQVPRDKAIWWFFETSEWDELELTDTGTAAFWLPANLVQKARKTAEAENLSLRGWILEKLSRNLDLASPGVEKERVILAFSSPVGTFNVFGTEK